MNQTKPKLQAKTVRKRLRQINQDLEKAEKAYKEAFSELRERCPHDWRFNSDTYESHYDCSICGIPRKQTNE